MKEYLFRIGDDKHLNIRQQSKIIMLCKYYMKVTPSTLRSAANVANTNELYCKRGFHKLSTKKANIASFILVVP